MYPSVFEVRVMDSSFNEIFYPWEITTTEPFTLMFLASDESLDGNFSLYLYDLAFTHTAINYCYSNFQKVQI